jgi:hypothetical protein
MKKILITILGVGLLPFISCESDLDSEGVTKGVIRYPSIEVLGETPFVLEAGSTFDDPGAKAFLGEDEITDQLEMASSVDAATPGVYTVTYSVATINELDQTSEVQVSRFVSVTDGNVCAEDMTGTYERNTTGIETTVTEVACGVFASDNFFTTATFTFTGLIFHVGNGELVIPEQNSPYGRYEGTGQITEDGFQFECQLLDQAGSVARIFIKQ